MITVIMYNKAVGFNSFIFFERIIFMSRSIILPIKPEYTEKILKGTKKYEFRKRACREKIDKIYIYETAPVKKVVAEVSVDEIIKGSPQYIWNICSKYGGINKQKYDQYFNDSPNAAAYKLGCVKKYEKPKELSDFGVDYVPQSFVYVV